MSFGNMRRSAQQDAADLAGCVNAFGFVFLATMLIVVAVCWWAGW